MLTVCETAQGKTHEYWIAPFGKIFFCMYFSYKKKLPHSKRRDSVCHSAIKMWLLGYVVGAVGLVVGLVVVLLVISKLKRRFFLFCFVFLRGGILFLCFNLFVEV